MFCCFGNRLYGLFTCKSFIYDRTTKILLRTAIPFLRYSHPGFQFLVRNSITLRQKFCYFAVNLE